MINHRSEDPDQALIDGLNLGTIGAHMSKLWATLLNALARSA
ncbi:MAG: hypothetical protein VB142_06500 [Burkholderia sp.]